MKNLLKEIQTSRTIRLIGALMETDKTDLPLMLQNELLDYKNDLDDFYQAVEVLKEEMASSDAYKDTYIDNTIEAILLENAPSLEIIINSGGGAVSEGFAIIDLIKELQTLYGVEVNTHVIGECASMAVAVYMAGDIRTAGENAIFMMHQISGGARGSQNKIESTINLMNIMTKKYKGMFKDTRIPEETLNEIMSHDTDHYFDIDQAREWGIVNDDDLIEEAMEKIKDAIEDAVEESVDVKEIDEN